MLTSMSMDAKGSGAGMYSLDLLSRPEVDCWQEKEKRRGKKVTVKLLESTARKQTIL